MSENNNILWFAKKYFSKCCVFPLTYHHIYGIITRQNTKKEKNYVQSS